MRPEDDIRSLVDQIVARFGRLDVAVNTAGTEGKPGPVTEQSAESYAAVLPKTTVQSKKETCVASICTSAFKSDAEPPCGAASSTILDEGHRPSPSGSVHSVFRAVRVFSFRSG